MIRRSNGLPTVAKGARVRRANSTLALGAAFSNTAVPLDAVDWQYGGVVSTTANAGALTVVSGGLYRLSARMRFTAGTASIRGIAVFINGSVRTQWYGWGINTRAQGSDDFPLNAGDVVTLQAYTEAASANVFVDSPNDVGLTLTYLGPVG